MVMTKTNVIEGLKRINVDGLKNIELYTNDKYLNPGNINDTIKVNNTPVKIRLKNNNFVISYNGYDHGLPYEDITKIHNVKRLNANVIYARGFALKIVDF